MFWIRTGLIWIGQNNFLEDRINLDWTENFRTYSDRTEYIGIGQNALGFKRKDQVRTEYIEIGQDILGKDRIYWERTGYIGKGQDILGKDRIYWERTGYIGKGQDILGQDTKA